MDPPTVTMTASASASSAAADSKGNKPFLGGYRHRGTGAEFHHAETQTSDPVLEERRRKKAEARARSVSVGLQVKPRWNKTQQTDEESGAQTEDAAGRRVEGMLEAEASLRRRRVGEREVAPSVAGYITADEWREEQHPKIILIQRTVRRWLKTKHFFRARRELWAGRHDSESQEEDLDLPEGDEGEGDEEDKAPDSHKDSDKDAYQRMLAELESRHREERPKAEDEDAAGRRPGRLAREAAEAARGMARRAAARQADRARAREAATEHVVERAGHDRAWVVNRGKGSRKRVVMVETEGTRRAKVLADAYKALRETVDSESIDDRGEALKKALEVVDSLGPIPPKSKAASSFPSAALVRELLNLAAREADLMGRDVKPRNLSGLRCRIASVFLRIIRSPDVNPEIAKYEKLLPQSLLLSGPRPYVPSVPPPRKDQRQHRRESKATSPPPPPPPEPQPPSPPSSPATELCPSCRRHLPRARFPLSSSSDGGGGGGGGGSAAVGRCNGCLRLDSDARSGEELGEAFRAVFEAVRRGEEEMGNTTSPAFQMQEADVRYVVQNFWDGQSLLSGSRDLRSLLLVRWDRSVEWSPWNCVLLTAEEAEVHAMLGGGGGQGFGEEEETEDQDLEEKLEQAYGALLVEKVRHKHTLARNHFSRMTTMAKYFAKGSNNIKMIKINGKPPKNGGGLVAVEVKTLVQNVENDGG